MGVVNEVSKSRTEAGLQCLYSTVVEPHQIDQLGHMNVRIYGACAMSGTRALAIGLGLPDLEQQDGEARIGFTDLYTRHYREQLVGAPLEVWGGVLEVHPTQLRIYNELVNPDREELAATFVHVMQLEDPSTHAPLPLAQEVTKSAEDSLIEWPEHGRSRSVDLDKDPVSLPLLEARARGLETRKPRLIEQVECDSAGRYKADSFLDLVWGGDDIDGSNGNNWLRDLGDGRKMGWATMESRGSLAELPHVGTRVQSFGCAVELGRKTRHERYWVYNIETEALLCTASIVNVAFDIDARKAIEVPPEERARLEQRFHPDLL